MHNNKDPKIHKTTLNIGQVFAGGPVVESPSCNTEDTESIPDVGGSHHCGAVRPVHHNC